MAAKKSNPLLDKAAQVRDALRKIDESTGLRTAWTAGSQAEVAEFFGVSINTVGNWAKQVGWPGRERNNRLDLIVQWLRGSGPWQDRLSRGNSDPEGIDHKLRKLIAEADLKEMQAELQAGEVVPRELLRRNLAKLADALRGLGDDFGRVAIPINGRDAQRKLNDLIASIEWEV